MREIMTRNQCFDFLCSIGGIDISQQEHGAKDKKCVRYYVAKTSWIDFNFDYEGYTHVMVTANKRKHVSARVEFKDLYEWVKKNL